MRPEEEELSNFFRNKSWASRGAARARLLYTGPAISYGRRFRPITLTRLTRGIQSANARGGLRLAALRAKSPNNARREFLRDLRTRRSACTIAALLNPIHEIFVTNPLIDLPLNFCQWKFDELLDSRILIFSIKESQIKFLRCYTETVEL